MPVKGIERILKSIRVFNSPKTSSSQLSRRSKQQLEILTRILQDNLLPFWRSRTLDFEDGGYRLNHDFHGVWLGKSNKRLVSHARTVWFFSHVARSKFATDDDLRAAKHGFEFLKNHLWDDEFGGFYWETDSTGNNVTMPRKHVFAQAAALYGLSEYWLASGAAEAKQLADQLFDLLERKSHDDRNEGYVEFLNRDWSPILEGTPNYLEFGNTNKCLNTHLHMMEAISLYYSVTKERHVYRRLRELITIQSEKTLRKETGTCSNEFLADWTPVKKVEDDRVSYGHNLENVWLLMEACEAAEIPITMFQDQYQNVFDSVFQHGNDTKAGGFYQEGNVHQAADKRLKIWWVQAEAIVCCLKMYLLTRETRYLSSFDQTLDWITNHQVDWKNGDWYARVDEKGKPGGIKTGHWKCAFHTGRSLLRCIAMLESCL